MSRTLCWRNSASPVTRNILLFGLLLGLIRLILLSGARKRANVTVFDALEPIKVAVDDNVSTLPTADALSHERMVDRAEALLLKARTNMERFGMAIMVLDMSLI